MFPEKVRQTVCKYGMLEEGDRVVVAVSGGPDSTALVSVLVSLQEEFEITLHLAHLNHMFRGEEAKEDRRYVEKLARKFCLPVTLGEKNVPAFIKKEKLSPEEGARQVRYEFLSKVAREVKADAVVVGVGYVPGFEDITFRRGIEGHVREQRLAPIPTPSTITRR